MSVTPAMHSRIAKKVALRAGERVGASARQPKFGCCGRL